MARGGGSGVGPVVQPAVIAYNLREASSWWHDINASSLWQDRIFHTLALLYGLVAVVALVQLIRIQLRVPEYGWTTQKVFHFLNFVVNAVRSAVFVCRRQVQKLNPVIVQHVLLDMPSLAFFTTYALLVLFWAEIYYQARAVSTDGLRPSFFSINAIVYVIQIAMWLILWWKPIPVLLILSKMFFAGVSLFAALGFLLYGGRLFLMLQRFLGPLSFFGASNLVLESFPSHFFAVGGNTALFFGPFHFEEIASKAWDHTIPPYSLFQLPRFHHASPRGRNLMASELTR